jgi:hypothetical protein
MPTRRDARVDAYIEGLPGWQQKICREVRRVVHSADRQIVETIKRTRLPYFVLEGNVCALLGTKDHVNVFLYDGARVPDRAGGWRSVPAHGEARRARSRSYQRPPPAR